jgi:uncharacterized membrane protein/sporulation protein YlmC with PRC-barrel domain
MIDIPLNAEVECADGRCGRSTCVIINPATQEVTHFVVKEKRLPHTERLVPIAWVEGTTPDLISLRRTKDELAKLEPFIATEFVQSERPRYIDIPFAMWPYVVPESMTVPVKHRRIPPDELAVRRGAHVRATDGDVGRVDEFLVDSTNGHITHLVLREGHLWNQKDVTIPVSQIDHVLGDTVYLKLDKEAIQSLPAVPVRRRYVWGRASIIQLELMASVFSQEGTADEALQALKRLNKEWDMKILAAALTKAQDGKTSVNEMGDVDAKHGALTGAIAGSLIGLLAGTPGAIVGATAGAVTGGVTAHEIDMGFSDECLKRLQEGLQPGSSAIVVVVERSWVKRVLKALARFGGRVARQALTDEVVEQFTAALADEGCEQTPD